MNKLWDPLFMILESLPIFLIWCKIGFPCKRNKLKLGIFILAISIIQPFLTGYKFRFLITDVMIISGVVMFFKIPLRKTLLEFVAVTLCSYIVLVPAMLIATLLVGSDFSAYGVNFFILSLVLVIVIILCKYLPLDKWYRKYESMLEKFIYVFIGALLLANMFTLVRLNDADKLAAFVLIFSTFIAVSFAFIQSLIETKEHNEMIRTYEHNASMVVPLLDEIRSRQHDFKNHLATIYGFCQQGTDNIPNVCEYIEGLNNVLKNDDTFIYMQDKTIGAILYSKACEASSKGVEFRYELPDAKLDFPFMSYEYAAIINNLIDNAFESPPSPGTDVKKVLLRIGAERGKKFIEVWNNGMPIPAKDANKLFKKGFSTKEDKSSHGFGLYTVKKIADQYSAAIEVIVQGSFTIFKISLDM